MACPGHGEGTGTVRCASCNKLGCEACFEFVGGAFLCTDCLVERLQQVEVATEQRNDEIESRAMVAEARGRIRRNWILTGISSLLIVPAMIDLIGHDPAVPSALKLIVGPLAGVTAAYLLWSALWGIPAAWRWWRNLFRGFSFVVFSSPFGWLVLAVSFFVIPLYLGYLYGVFGGAVHEYIKARKLARNASMGAPA